MVNLDSISEIEYFKLISRLFKLTFISPYSSSIKKINEKNYLIDNTFLENIIINLTKKHFKKTKNNLDYIILAKIYNKRGDFEINELVKFMNYGVCVNYLKKVHKDFRNQKYFIILATNLFNLWNYSTDEDGDRFTLESKLEAYHYADKIKNNQFIDNEEAIILSQLYLEKIFDKNIKLTNENIRDSYRTSIRYAELAVNLKKTGANYLELGNIQNEFSGDFEDVENDIQEIFLLKHEAIKNLQMAYKFFKESYILADIKEIKKEIKEIKRLYIN